METIPLGPARNILLNPAEASKNATTRLGTR
jgi:hypothetical protein